MHDRTLARSRCGLLAVRPITVVLVSLVAGCGTSGPPAAPNIRIEGPPGTMVGYGLSYHDNDGKDFGGTGSTLTIPESGVYTEKLESNHEGIWIQVTTQTSDPVTLILLDGEKELQKVTSSRLHENLSVKAGEVKFPTR